jgi:hypothetical protein
VFSLMWNMFDYTRTGNGAEHKIFRKPYDLTRTGI